MYNDDQDDDVEEEEEFHDVEEEKHKTSQESVGSSGDVISSPARNKTPSVPQRSKSEEIPPEDQSNATVVLENPVAKSDEIDASTSSEITTDEKISPELATTTTSDKAPEATSSSVQHSRPSTIPDAEHQPQPSLTDNVDVTNAANDSPNIDAQMPDGSASCQHSEKSNLDWANMMLADHSDGSDSASEATSSSDNAQSDIEEAKQNVKATSDDSIIDNIVKDTQDKLKIGDESKDSNDLKLEPSPEQSVEQQTIEKTSEETACPAPSLPTENTDESEDKTSEQAPDVADAAPENDLKGDQVEEVEKKELDLDEDVKNPQYIPKKGVFYEHDDRSHDVEEKKPISSSKNEEDTTEAKDASANMKNTSQDKQPETRRNNRRQRTDADRWNHDLFRGEKQKPKSKSELINAYGYDIRQERSGRVQTDGRQARTNNASSNDRPQGSQDSQRSRQPRDGRGQRQNQDRGNRSRDRRARRQNSTRNGQQRTDGAVGLDNKRDNTNSRSTRPDIKDLKESGDTVKQTTPPSSVMPTNSRREQENSGSRGARNDSKGRRKTSRDRPLNVDDRLPPPNTVMPPITTWSNEDMVKAEAFGKSSPPRIQPQVPSVNSINNIPQRDRSTDFWHQNSQQNKAAYQDRSVRGQEDTRQQGYNSRGRYQDRANDGNWQANYVHRNHFSNDRVNQQQDWNRAGNFSPYGKSTDYVVKTQTFENSRLAQANMSNSANNRDLREVLNERRLQSGKPSYQPKVHRASEHHSSQRGPAQGHVYQQQQPYAQSHSAMHQHQQQMAHNHQQNSQQHLMHHHQQPQPHQQPQHSQSHDERHQLSAAQQQPTPGQTQPRSTSNSQPHQSVQNDRQPPQSIQAQSQQRQNISINHVANDTSGQESARLGAVNNTDPMSSRPIIKTDAYTGTGMHPHQQPLPQHSQNHRTMTGPITQQGPPTSHMVPSHLGASSSQYYAPSPNPRDAAAAASAYHGYIPGGHAVMDPTRYHIASQQLADHGYMTNPGQGSEVPGSSVLHQQGMYADASAGVAGSAYLPQPPGSTISPTANIPVTGTGGQQLPPVNPYLQHSQYPPPPYSNPYSQHNQGPPQSSHGYPPYWTYI